jgi:hypothetical protein
MSDVPICRRNVFAGRPGRPVWPRLKTQEAVPPPPVPKGWCRPQYQSKRTATRAPPGRGTPPEPSPARFPPGLSRSHSQHAPALASKATALVTLQDVACCVRCEGLTSPVSDTGWPEIMDEQTYGSGQLNSLLLIACRVSFRHDQLCGKATAPPLEGLYSSLLGSAYPRVPWATRSRTRTLLSSFFNVRSHTSPRLRRYMR